MKKIKFTVSEQEYVVRCEDEWGVEVFHWNARRMRFVISISIDGGEPKDFYYFDSVANYPKPIDEDGLRRAFECIVMDAMAGLCGSVDEFMREFGYKDYREAEKLYTACNRALRFFQRHDVDIYELQEYVSEF